MRHKTMAVVLIGAMYCSMSAAWSLDHRWSTKQSAHDVTTTVERLVSAIEKRGANVSRIDYAAAAEAGGLELRPTTLVIFDNPTLSALLMLDDQRVGLDMPLRFLVWQDAAGSVNVGYLCPERLVESYAVAKRSEIVKTMAETLTAITQEATAR